MLILILASYVAAGSPFSCTPTAVWDGDGPIWCAEGPKVRLAGIAARERDETCREGQPCPTASGIASRDYLVSLLGGARGVLPNGHVKVTHTPLYCVSEGWGRGDRTAAFCQTSRGVDLSCALVQAGYALRWPAFNGDRVCQRAAPAFSR